MRDPLLMVVGAAIVAASLIAGKGAFDDWRRFHDTPVQVDLEEVVRTSREGRQWAAVNGAAWQCDRAIGHGVYALVPAWTADGALVTARVLRPFTCEQLATATGVIAPMDSDERRDAQLLLTGTEPGLHLLNVCTDCGRDNARFGVLICALGVLFGFGLSPLRRLIAGWQSGLREQMLRAAHAPEDSVEANRAVRKRGALLIAIGAPAVAFTQGWVVWGVIPLPCVGAFAVLLGAALIVFPLQYRRLMARSTRSPRL